MVICTPEELSQLAAPLYRDTFVYLENQRPGTFPFRRMWRIFQNVFKPITLDERRAKLNLKLFEEKITLALFNNEFENQLRV